MQFCDHLSMYNLNMDKIEDIKQWFFQFFKIKNEKMKCACNTLRLTIKFKENSLLTIIKLCMPLTGL